MTRLAFLCAALTLFSASAHAATLSLTEKGIKIDVVGLGDSVLEYPTLATKKPLETRVEGKSATLKYDGGGQIVVDVSDSSQIVLKFSDLPADAQNYAFRMNVGLGQGPNRKWKFDDKAGEFPLQKAEKPHLFQGSAKTFTVINYENRSITFTVPNFAYQQLTDNRHWGWNTFFWNVLFPLNKDWKTQTIHIQEGNGGEIKKVTLVDKFGQSNLSDWPNKVRSEDELKSDVESERAYFNALKPPATNTYGSLPGSRQMLGLKATGYFHVEKSRGRWLMVDPEGDAFFHLGICGFGPSDDYTTIKGREQIYEAIPPFDGMFQTAYRRESGRDVVSFQLANMIRKYGEPYSLDTYTGRMIERTRKWGFNSMGAFSLGSGSPSAKAANFPYVASLPLGRWNAGILPVSESSHFWDPFDEQNRAKMEKSLSESLPRRANDPLLIGYFLDNEPLYEEIPKVVPALKGNSAAKRRLVRFLSEKYRTIGAFNTTWQMSADSFESLVDAPLTARTSTARDDLQEYTGLFLDAYFVLVTETFRKYDPHHLLLGNRLQSGTINNEQLCRIMGKYLDVISYNYYTYAFDTNLLNRLHNWIGDKPMILSEFYWSSPQDSGLSSRQDVSSQQERGLAYRNYVEQAAALDYVVGIEWFTLVDQATTGRWFSGFNGEAANTGLISTADRPWKPMLAEMMKTNYAIYDVWLGKQKPFVWNDPRFSRQGGGRKVVPVSRATGPMKIDGNADNWPGVPAELISSQRLVLGANPEGFEGSFKLCWDDTNLYLLANVKDPTPQQNPQSGRNLWNGDGLELFIGSEKLGEGGALLFKDRQILLGAGKSGQSYLVNAPDQTDLQTAVVPGVDGKSYTLEAAIPWAVLSVQPIDNLELLFDLAIDDSTGNGRTRQLVWNGTVKNSTDRSNWGRARLVR